jgi:hypothetical protein
MPGRSKVTAGHTRHRKRSALQMTFMVPAMQLNQPAEKLGETAQRLYVCMVLMPLPLFG